MEPDVAGNVEALADCETEAGVWHGRAWQGLAGSEVGHGTKGLQRQSLLFSLREL